jgi:hypothetical protein
VRRLTAWAMLQDIVLHSSIYRESRSDLKRREMINMPRIDELFCRMLVWFVLYNSAYTLACPEGALCCNNVEICDLPVDEILFGMVHNAMSSPSAGFIFFPNHMDDPIVESLDYGKD